MKIYSYKFLLVSGLMAIGSVAFSQSPLYKNKSASIPSRVQDLLKRMTLEEKVLQLSQLSFGNNTNANNIGNKVKNIPAGIGSLIYNSDNPVYRNQMQKKAMEETRLGIPILFGNDVIHGLRTVYPISLAQACSWNPQLVQQACAMAAKESKLAGIDWTFSPMIDVARDGRWGRISEGYGEDPYTNAVFGVASVKGYQGNHLSDSFSIAACLKHYVGYGASEGGRDYSYTEISQQTLWDTYLPPFEACVKAGAATLMSSFNDISGVPSSANHYTLTEILKDKWKHQGFVVSDWNAVEQLINQGVAANRKEAGYKAFNAGVDMDMVDKIYIENMPQLLAEKKITQAKIDDAVSRVLHLKFQLGLFDKPFATVLEENERVLLPASRKLAQDLASESIVLLKNKQQMLPIKSNIKSVALIGPMVKDRSNIMGSWAFDSKDEDAETIWEGFGKVFANQVAFNYAKGCDFDSTDESGFQAGIEQANQSDLVIVCLGEKKKWSGENGSRSTLALPAIQEKLVMELKKSGKPIVLVLSSGRPLELVRLEPLADAIVNLWQPGVQGGSALADIVKGNVNPSGKLAVTFPLTTGQIPTYYNMRPNSRTNTQGNYKDISTAPLYWFGHGLSYTTYQYDSVKISATKVKKNEKIVAEVTVSNTGKVSGKETVLWFISNPACSISRPMKELKYFEKKEIAAGGKATYKFEIDPMRDLSFVDATGKKFLESGSYFLLVGGQKVKIEIE